MRPQLVAASACLAVLIGAAPARAALDLRQCQGDREARCATLTVPLDRSGRVAGRVALRVQLLPARRGRPRGTVFALAGGPGDSNVDYFTERRSILEAIRDDHDVIVFDQRGTGSSGLLNCPGLQRGDPPESAVPACAAQLGERRGLYTTPHSADDLDAVRAAVGAQRITIYGLSYGTWVAQVYARKYPARVRSLVLDGVVSSRVQSDDPFGVTSFAALPGALRASCARRACRGITADPWADLLAVARRTPLLRGTLVDERGRPRSAELNVPLFAQALFESDVNVFVRAQLPAALARARAGDPRLALRLGEAASLPTRWSPREFSAALNTAALCEEVVLPWARTTPPGQQREAEIQQRLRALPEDAIEPLDRALAPLFSLASVCKSWPTTPADPGVPGPLPNIPALVMNGDADIRTPLSEARRVARELPRSILLTAPSTGHNVLASPTLDCGRRALAEFLHTGGVTRCRAAENRFRPAPPPPAALSRTPVASGARGTVGRLLTAVALTVQDSVTQIQMRVRRIRRDDASVRAGGFLGGRLRGSARRVTLSGAELVPGVRVSGAVTGAGLGTVRVDGPLDGTLTLGPTTIGGRLGGRQVAGRRP